MELELTRKAAEELRKRGGVAAIDFVPAIAWGGYPEVSVDTYLKGKRINGYVSVDEGDLRLLISQTLYREAELVRLGVSEFLFWRKLNVVAVPRADHFHSPACRH